VTVNDVGRLRDGQAQYTVVCVPDGGIVDDVIVYRFSSERYLFCVNAGNREAMHEWLVEHRGAAEVVDRSDEFAQLALQGPRAMAILGRLTALDVRTVPPFEFRELAVADRAAIVARTGYTGEDGWEVYCAAEAAVTVWNALLEAGRGDGLQPAGLGARDTLPPLEAGLRRFVRLDKGDFIGGDVLRRQEREGVRRRLVGLALIEPGIPRQGYAIVREGKSIGVVTSGTKSPTLGKAIGLGYVSPDWGEVHTTLGIEIRGRTVAAQVVPRPFYRRSRSAAEESHDGVS
jgi:aminomethyltransferase